MTHRRDDRIEAFKTACLTLLLLFGLATPAPAHVRQDTSADALAAAREALVEATATEYALGLHVASLLTADDLASLGDRLAEGHEVVAKVIMETLAFNDDIRLLDQVLLLAASAASEDIAQQATELLHDQAPRHDAVRANLVATLASSADDDSRCGTLIEAIGFSRDLDVVPTLLIRLEGPEQPAVLRAFQQLSGHDLSGEADPITAWKALWERQQQDDLTREDLLEEGHALQRARWVETNANTETKLDLVRRERDLLHAEVVAARIDSMAGKIDKLIEALDDDYAAVRQVAAERLGDHPAHAKAVQAIPVLLERLGHKPKPAGTNGDHSEPVLEQDAEVRATLVTALGRLGRDRPAVMHALLAELADGELAVARAAVDALIRVKGQPMVVRPLLDFLDSEEIDQGTSLQVLEIIANNEPAGVLDELSSRLGEATEGVVRGVLVQAMLASQELGQAMVVLSVLDTTTEAFEVRFALAQSLGDRLANLPLDAPPRPAMIGVIEDLLDDEDESVRAQAAKSLGESGDTRAASLLAERAKSEISGSVLLDIVSALGQVGSLQCAASIGWIHAHDTSSDGEGLSERARDALQAIGRGRPWSEWMVMAETLADAEAPELSLMVLNEILAPPAGGAVIDADVADRARGLKALELIQIGATQVAHDLLLQLEQEGKPYPPREQLLNLLAQTCRELGLHSEGADWLVQLCDGRLEADARFDELQRWLAGELLAAQRNDEAIELLERLHTEQPTDNQFMLWLGKARMSVGRDAEARSLLDRLEFRVPEDDLAMLAEVRELLDQLGEAPAPIHAEPGNESESDSQADPEEVSQPPGDDEGLDQPTSTDGGGVGER
jgi:tetratricopeptide (TPR) repeat protein